MIKVTENVNLSLWKKTILIQFLDILADYKNSQSEEDMASCINFKKLCCMKNLLFLILHLKANGLGLSHSPTFLSTDNQCKVNIP